MKGLRKFLAPFAPDQSGAAAVLHALGGMLVILDAGGCAGNICGFDEPRWAAGKSMVFSAGLRDMDAILGRDDALTEKLCSAAQRLRPSFIALIGTPVPSVIGTDYRALRRMAEKRTGLPVLTVDTTGMALYDVGAEKAYLALMERFACEGAPARPGCVGVLGLTPLDFGAPDAAARMAGALRAEGYDEILCYGAAGGPDAVRAAPAAALNVVAAPAGLRAAQYLQKKFGTPFVCRDPLAAALLPNGLTARRALVVHQQVRADALRRALEARGAMVTAASWFMQPPEAARPGDIRLTEEDQLADLLRTGGFDLLVGDKALWAAVPDGAAQIVDAPHFALSGRLG